MNKKETRKYSEVIPLESANNKTNKIPSNITKITRDIAMLTVFSVPSVFAATLEEKNIFLEKLHYNKIINEALSVPNAIFEKISVASSTSSTPTSVDLIDSLNKEASGDYEKFAINPNGITTKKVKTTTDLKKDILFHFPNNGTNFNVNLSPISRLGATPESEITDLGLDETTIAKFFLKNGNSYLFRWDDYSSLEEAISTAGLNNNTEITQKLNKIYVNAVKKEEKAFRVLNIKGEKANMNGKDVYGLNNSFDLILDDFHTIYSGDSITVSVSQNNPENESKIVMSLKKSSDDFQNNSAPSPLMGQNSQTRSGESFFIYSNGQAKAFYDNSFKEFTDANNYYPTTNDKYKNFPIPLNFNPENLNYKIASLDTVPSPMEFACVNKNTNKWEIYSAQGYKALAFRTVKDEYKEFFQFDPKVNVYSGTFTDEADLRTKNTAKGSPLSEEQLTDLLATPSIAPLANTTDNFSAIYNHCAYKLNNNEAVYGDMKLKKESGIKSDGEANFSETGSEGVPILSRDQNETRTTNSGDGKIHTVKYEAAMSSVFAEMAKNSFTITTEVESSFEDALSPSAEIMKRLMVKTCKKYNETNYNNPSETVLSEMRNILGLDSSSSNPLFWNLDNDGNEKSYAEQEPWLKTRATLEVFAASLKTLCKETSNNKVYDNLVTILSQMGNTNSVFDASVVEEFLKENSRKHIDYPGWTNTSKEIAKVFKYFADYLQAVDRANLSETKNKMIAEFPGILEFIDMDDKDENITFTESIGILQQLFEDPRSIKAFIADENGLFLQKGTIKTVKTDRDVRVTLEEAYFPFKESINCKIIWKDSNDKAFEPAQRDENGQVDFFYNSEFRDYNLIRIGGESFDSGVRYQKGNIIKRDENAEEGNKEYIAGTAFIKLD